MGEFPSGQRGQTVNLLRFASMVQIHSLPPRKGTRKGAFFVVGRGCLRILPKRHKMFCTAGRTKSTNVEKCSKVRALWHYGRDCFPARRPSRFGMAREVERLKATLPLWLQIHSLPPRRRGLRIVRGAFFMLAHLKSPLHSFRCSALSPQSYALRGSLLSTLLWCFFRGGTGVSANIAKAAQNVLHRRKNEERKC